MKDKRISIILLKHSIPVEAVSASVSIMKLDTALRARHRAMILSPLMWPHVNLPLKRPHGGPDSPDVATLLTATTDPNAEFQIDLNRSIFGPIGEIERITFSNVDALLDAGWEVD